MRKKFLVSMLILGVLLISGCNTTKESSPKKETISNEEIIGKMVSFANDKYPNNVVTAILISDGESGNWRGQVNLADYDQQTLVNIYFPYLGKEIKKKTNPWDQEESELVEEIAELQEQFGEKGLVPEELPSTDYYREEIQKIITLNEIELEEPLEIDFSYGLAAEGLQVQCSFQAESKKKHLFVFLFEEKKLTTIVCETLELAPVEGVEIYDLKSE